jgi:hypothetical protein
MCSVGPSDIRAASEAVLLKFSKPSAERPSCDASGQSAAEAVNTLCSILSSIKIVSEDCATELYILTDGLSQLLQRAAWVDLAGSLQSIEPQPVPHHGWSSRFEHCTCAPELLLLLFQMAVGALAKQLFMSDGDVLSDRALLSLAAWRSLGQALLQLLPAIASGRLRRDSAAALMVQDICMVRPESSQPDMHGGLHGRAWWQACLCG